GNGDGAREAAAAQAVRVEANTDGARPDACAAIFPGDQNLAARPDRDVAELPVDARHGLWGCESTDLTKTRYGGAGSRNIAVVKRHPYRSGACGDARIILGGDVRYSGETHAAVGAEHNVYVIRCVVQVAQEQIAEIV